MLLELKLEQQLLLKPMNPSTNNKLYRSEKLFLVLMKIIISMTFSISKLMVYEFIMWIFTVLNQKVVKLKENLRDLLINPLRLQLIHWRLISSMNR